VRAPSLAQRYDALYRAHARGDVLAAHAAFLALVGLSPRRGVEVLPTAAPPARAPVLDYTRPRRVDLLALQHGGRDVAKFEDLTAGAAAALGARLQAAGLRVVRAGPYTRRFDAAVATDGGGGLYSVIASRGAEAEAVARAEQDRGPEGTLRAGLALGYPRCCVERFVAVSQGDEARDDGVNEAVLRAFVGGGDVPWRLNPLSQDALVNFMPCAPGCAPARAFADRVLAAVVRADPGAEAHLRRVLSRPVLFFRYAVFYALDGATVEGTAGRGARYARAVPYGVGPVTPLDLWQHDELGVPLAGGDAVTLDAQALTVWAGPRALARWAVADGNVPRLLVFGDGA
jgi:hypothetical protein